MSRHLIRKNDIVIAYGYDDMMPLHGGYFFQVFDKTKETEDNEEGIVVNEGFVRGISRNRMAELMTEWEVSNKRHLKAVALDLPI
jgi:hypothetical protein